MKSLFLRVANNLRLIATIYVASLILAAYLFQFFENRTFLEGLWWAIVTALTIGYGDISPVTLEGKTVAFFFSHFWIYLVGPMIIGNIILQILQDQEKFTHEEQEWQEASLKAIAEQLGVELPKSPRDY